jgi:hypothetical protein
MIDKEDVKRKEDGKPSHFALDEKTVEVLV